MKRLILILCLLFSLGFSQQQATLSGIVKSGADLPEGTRVGVFTVNSDNVWQQEVASSGTVGGTFSVTLGVLSAEALSPFRSGAVLFPDLTNEYTVAPEDVAFARGQVGMYVDSNGSASFDGMTQENVFLGIASLEDPTGFFSLIYVDKAATLSGRGVTLELAPGWNVFTVTYPQGEEPAFAVSAATDKALLDVFLP